MQMLIKIVINAVALVVAALVVPKFNLDFGSGTSGYIYVALVAIIFGLVNAYIKPIATLVSLPLNLFALGLVGFIVNAAMLLLTTWVVGLLHSHPYILKLGEFPPNLGVNAIVAAVIGSIVISIVSTVLSLVLPGLMERKRVSSGSPFEGRRSGSAARSGTAIAYSSPAPHPSGRTAPAIRIPSARRSAAWRSSAPPSRNLERHRRMSSARGCTSSTPPTWTRSGRPMGPCSAPPGRHRRWSS